MSTTACKRPKQVNDDEPQLTTLSDPIHLTDAEKSFLVDVVKVSIEQYKREKKENEAKEALLNQLEQQKNVLAKEPAIPAVAADSKIAYIGQATGPAAAGLPAGQAAQPAAAAAVPATPAAAVPTGPTGPTGPMAAALNPAPVAAADVPVAQEPLKPLPAKLPPEYPNLAQNRRVYITLIFQNNRPRSRSVTLNANARSGDIYQSVRAACQTALKGSLMRVPSFLIERRQGQILIEIENIRTPISWYSRIVSQQADFEPGIHGVILDNLGVRAYAPPSEMLIDGDNSKDLDAAITKFWNAQCRKQNWNDDMFRSMDVLAYKFSVIGLYNNGEDDKIYDLYRSSVNEPVELSQNQLNVALTRLTETLIKSQEYNGKFLTYPDRVPYFRKKNFDEISDHAYATLTLGKLYRHNPQENLLKGLKNGLKYLMSSGHTITTKNGQDEICIRADEICSLKNSALALWALLQLPTNELTEADTKRLDGIVHFFQAFQQADGSFQDYQIKKQERVSPKEQDIEGIGLAVIALLEGSQQRSQAEWLELAKKSGQYLLGHAHDQDFMAQKALARLAAITKDQTIASEVQATANKISHDQYTPANAPSPDIIGGYGANNIPEARQTALSTNLLIQARLLAGTADSNLTTPIFRGVKFLLNQQVTLVNSFGFAYPQMAVGGIRASLIDNSIHYETNLEAIEAFIATIDLLKSAGGSWKE
jgi:hypothetical protein